MNGLLASVTQNLTLTIVTFCAIALLTAFLVSFTIPALRLLTILAKARKTLRKFAPSQASSEAAVAQLDTVFQPPPLSEPWAEYRKTLHRRLLPQADPLSPAPLDYRATALADIAFDDRAVIDVAINSEFFKHLPGIFTGFGIIATFSGLINGLSQFGASADPVQAQNQLHGLIASVGSAFKFSAFAISIAIIVTLIEKILYSLCSSRLAAIRYQIDRIFAVGAGEEYLQQAAIAATSTELHLNHLKTHIIVDLQTMLQTLLNQQTEKRDSQANQLPQLLSTAIADQLGKPIANIASAVERITAQQGDAVNDLLGGVLERFSQRIEQMFGDQLATVASNLSAAADAMRESTSSFGNLAERLGSAGSDAVLAMGQQLERVVADLQSRQVETDNRLMLFLNSMRAVTEESAQQTGTANQEMLQAVGSRMNVIMAAMESRSKALGSAQQEAQVRLEEQSETMLSQLSTSFAQSVQSATETNGLIAGAIERLAQISDQAISGMNTSAQTVRQALSELAQSSQGVAQTLSGTTQVSNDLRAASTSINAALANISEMLNDYNAARTQVAQLTTEFQAIVAIAKREAGLTAELTQSLEAAAGKLNDANLQAVTYLSTINAGLTEAHQDFGEALRQTLQDANRQFNGELHNLTLLVRAMVAEVSDKVDMMSLAS